MGNISFKDFKKLDIRVGTVVKAEVPDWSHWVIKLTVGLGSELGERTIFAGVLGFYEPKDLEGKQFPFIVNLEPKNIGPKGDVSEGMMLAAVLKLDKPVKIAVDDPTSHEATRDEETDEKPVLFELSEKVPNGTKVS